MTGWRRIAVVAGVTAVVSLGAYLATLGWDQDGSYAFWQVGLLVVALVALAVWATIAGSTKTGGVVLVVVITAAWSVDAATDARSDGLWAVGAIGVLIGTALGYAAASMLVSDVHRRRRTQLHF